MHRTVWRSLVAGEDGRSAAILDGFSKDAVAVEVVDDEQVVIASAGGSDEATRLVGVNLTGGFHEGSEAVMRTGSKWLIVECVGGEGIGIVKRRRAGVGGGLGGALVHAALVEMPLDHGERSRRMFAQASEGKAGEIGNVAFGECSFQRGERR